MQYTEVTITLSAVSPWRDLIVDTLGNEGPYDSFVETAGGLKAYIPADLFDADWLKARIEELAQPSSFTFQLSVSELPDRNWNEEWERQHKPVYFTTPQGTGIYVRAPFHPLRDDADYQIEIEPKMSFGTAHHATTQLMLSFIADMDLAGQRVLDMGCGTAILAILASKRGAAQVEAIDVDEWAYRNALENIGRNTCGNIHCRLGDATLLPTMGTRFDLVIANINRNILLHDMATYTAVLRTGGTMLLSGFYLADIPALATHADTLGLALAETKEQDGWSALKLQKS